MSRPAAGAVIEGVTVEAFDWADADLAEAGFVDCVIADAQFSNTILEGARFSRCRIAPS